MAREPLDSVLPDVWSTRMSRVAAPLRDQVSNALRQAIIARDLKPGQRLVERELVDRLNVSRATIRESLRELEAEGMVTVIPQHGAVVASISPQEAADLYEARAAIESLIVRRFVERASDAQVARLSRALDDLSETTVDQLPIHEILDAKSRLYDVLNDGSDSAVLATLLTTLQARVSRLRVASLAHPGRPLEMLQEMRTLTDAITRRDADEAARLCAEHVRNAARIGLAELDENSAAG